MAWMAMEYARVATAPHGSVALSVNVDVPAAVGVPAIAYVLSDICLTLKPSGSNPEASTNTAGLENGLTHPPLVGSAC